MSYWSRLVVLASVTFILGAVQCSAAVPPLVSYQGKLTEVSGQPVPDGAFSMRFFLYDQETAGNLLWQEPATGNPPTTVQVTGGLFTVLLGGGVPLTPSSFPGNSWLQTEVNGEALTPRIRIVSSAYAVRASTFDLPFAGTASSSIAEFSLWNTGTGSAGFFGINNAGSANPALEAKTNGSGPALKATTTGSGTAAEFTGIVSVTGAVQMDSFKLRTSPTVGSVLTSDASGVGTWQTPLPGTYTNVKAYGAKGDGVTDDTVAIRNAMTAAGSRNVVGTYSGGPTYISAAVVFFPAGKYVISDTITLGADVKGEGAIIYQNKATKDIFYSDSVWRSRISGMSFVGGKCHLSLFTNNVDSSQISIEKCHFQRASDCAIRIRPGSNSTQLNIRDCVFLYCNQVLVNTCDMAKMYDCWIMTAPYMLNQAAIENRGTLQLENICGVPVVTAGNDQRWIDNYGGLTCRNFRFGGEFAGFTPVVNWVSYSYQYPVIPSSVVLDNCDIYAAGNQARKAAVYCEQIPNQIIITNCRGFIDIVGVLVRSTINLNTYFDLAEIWCYDSLRFFVDPSNSFPYTYISSGADLPMQMRPHQVNPVEADAVPTTGNWRVGTFVKNRAFSGTGSPYGWICTVSGEPGTWKTATMTFGP